MRRCTAVSILGLVVVAQAFVFAGDASAQQMKVACVGDSITAPASGWCRYLGTKLGSGYTAQTFGVSGTTLLKNVGQPSYFSSSQFKPSHDFAPNIVVIMLGTNDSAPRNWNAGKDHFVKDYEELIDSYTSLATKPTVFLNTPPPASDDNTFTISGTNIEKEINPLIKQVAMTKMAPLVDIWAAFGGDVTKIGSFDGVHPGDAGQMLIGETVAKAIMSPSVPSASAGTGGAGGSSNAGAGGAAGSANTSGAGGGSANTSGVGGAVAGAGSGMAGSGAANGGATGGIAGGSANTGVAGKPSSANASGSPSVAGTAGSANTAGNASIVNGIGAAGMSTPVGAAAESDGGCRMGGRRTTNSGPTAALVVLLGLVIRSRKRRRS
jgi:alpha-L-fucosidase 2